MRDPFAAEDETTVYVSRPASERALAQMELAVAGGCGVSALVGPPGIGKSILLRVLAKRIERQACCVFPDAEALTADDLYVWIVRELDARETVETERALVNRSALLKFREWMRREWQETDVTNAEEALRMRAKDLGSRGFPVVALIDDADMLSDDTLGRFAELARSSDRTIAFAMTLSTGSRMDRSISALGNAAYRVDYSEPLSLAETAIYVPERLRKSNAPADLLACIDDARIRRIFSYSQGIPRRIHGELSLLHIELTRVRASAPWPAAGRGEGAAEGVERSESTLPAATAARTAPAESAPKARREATRRPPAAAQERAAEVPAARGKNREPADAPNTAARPAAEPTWTLPAARQEEPAVAWTPVEMPGDPADLETPDARETPAAVQSDEIALVDLAEEKKVEAAPPAATAPETRPAAPPTETPAGVAGSSAAEPAPGESAAQTGRAPLSSRRRKLWRGRAERVEGATVRAAEPQEPTPQAAEEAAPIVIAGAEASDAGLLEAVREDWTNLSERSVPLAELELAPELPQPAPAPAPPEAQPQVAEPAARPAVSARPEAAAARPARTAGPAVQPDPAPASAPKRVRTAASRRAPAPPAAATAPLDLGATDRSLLRWLAAAGTVIALLLAFCAVAMTVLHWRSEPREVATAPTFEPLPNVVLPAPQPQPELPAPAPEPAEPPSNPPPAVVEAVPPKLYRVNINAVPYATIEIDGNPAGETPLGDFPVAAGSHVFRAQMPSGEIKERSIDVVQDGLAIVFK